jgi:hypothetical protein
MSLNLRAALALVTLAALNACGPPDAEPTAAPAFQTTPAATVVGRSIPIENASFIGNAERRLPGWIKSEHGGGQSYTFTDDREIFHSAPSSGRIERHGPELFGLLSQSLNVEPDWVGQTLVLSAFLKTKGAETEGRGGGALIIRADRTGGGHAGQNFMENDRLRGDTNWQQRTIELVIPPGTGTIRVGAMLQGSGTLWIDDLSVTLKPTP